MKAAGFSRDPMARSLPKTYSSSAKMKTLREMTSIKELEKERRGLRTWARRRESETRKRRRSQLLQTKLRMKLLLSRISSSSKLQHKIFLDLQLLRGMARSISRD